MVGIIEGFEGEYCIIEVDGQTRDVPRELVGAGVKTGDVVEWDGARWNANAEKTKQRSEYVKSLMDDVWDD
ncbi:DUF3006 domain-containing protein [Paenibacillus sp. FSL W8-0186]|uniref:DUF3006 domain-containing protein n=1 Tax=Paenibacillus woosongensis TaxID=307580 RepID=A0ABQ4MPA8_9BACL|nr:DUF3006 domain-containing protein [Paenibacillus woosongensis]GIP57846.1 hypothetical protein J15TS10_16600 [Paenibacillus woosongensis]